MLIDLFYGQRKYFSEAFYLFDCREYKQNIFMTKGVVYV